MTGREFFRCILWGIVLGCAARVIVIIAQSL
jgi:hypothetical protein